MPYTNDTQSLADVVSPAFAAQQAGMQAANQQQEQQQQLAQTAQMNPLLVQHQQDQNAFQQQQTGYYGALTQGQQNKNDLESATMPGQIASTNSANGLKVSQDNVQKVGQIGQFATQLAPLLAQTPPMQRMAVANQYMKQAGIDPQQAAPYLGDDPTTMPDRLQQIGTQLIQQSQSYVTGMAETTAKEQGATQRNDIDNMTKLQVAKTAQQTAMYKQQRMEQIKKEMANTDQTVAMLSTKVANGSASPGEQQQLRGLTQYKASLSQALSSELVGGGDVTTPTQRATQAVDTMTGGAPSAAPVTSGQPLQQAASTAFGAYEPDKYQYRMGPQGIQRKPK